jgi:hypothetical protein
MKETTMAETIAKRTFFEGCYIEMFQRNDKTTRIKFVSPEGDEVVLNLSSKSWGKGIPQDEFDRIAYAPDIPDFKGTGSALPHNKSLWMLLVSCDSYIRNVVQQLGVSLEKEHPDACETGLIKGSPTRPTGREKSDIENGQPS